MLCHKSSKNKAVWISVLPGVLLLFALIPIILVGDCAHPFGDDYAYSVFLHLAMERGESGLGAILYTIHRYYFGWQGTYSAAALMSLQPGIWSEQAYILTPIIMLMMLIVPTALLTYTVLCKWLKCQKSEWMGFVSLFLLMTVLFQPSAAQAFFWWNGAVYYTFFFGVMLLLICCMLRLYLNPKHPKLLMAAALFLTVFVGGGNYVTGLFSCLFCAFCTLLCLIWDRRRVGQHLTIFLVLLASFLINALAPGNAVRQASATGMSVFSAIWASIIQVFLDTYQWMDLAHLGFFLLMIPFLWHIAGKTSFRFPWPGAVTVLLFLALASQNTPHFYALSTEGPGRLRNIVYDAWLWLLLMGEGYWIGWLRRVCKKNADLTSGLAGVLVSLGMVMILTGSLYPLYSTTSGQCAAALMDGSAAQYDAQINGWVEQFSTGDEENVICPALTVQPPVLFYYNLTDNPEDFSNIAAANYYEKESIAALPSN